MLLEVQETLAHRGVEKMTTVESFAKSLKQLGPGHWLSLGTMSSLCLPFQFMFTQLNSSDDSLHWHVSSVQNPDAEGFTWAKTG